MTNLREIASRCEAKLHAFRRTQDGVVVSFVVHPAEVPPVLALDPLGTRYMLAFVAIADDETPIPACAPQRERPAAPPSSHASGGATSMPDVGEESVLGDGAKSSTQPGCGTKMRRPWYDMPPSQRAGIMCKEERFWIWLSRFKGALITDEDEATNWLYQECGIDSRSELRLDTDASPDVQAFLREQLRVFYAVESDYRKWAGLEREVR